MSQKSTPTSAGTFKEFWNSLPFIVRLIIIIVIVVGIVLLIKMLLDNYKKNQRQKVLENNVQTTTVTNSQGNNVTYTADLGTRAAAIHAAFYDNDVFGLTEDEDAAVMEILNVPKPLIPDLSAVYYQAYKKNLKADFMKYAADEWPKISYLFA